MVVRHHLRRVPVNLGVPAQVHVDACQLQAQL
jgi:hypothetical protein